MDAILRVSRGLDLDQLLIIHTGIALVGGLGTSPTYNLPVYLYGLVVSHMEFDSMQMKRFAYIFASTAFLDILWILSSSLFSITTLLVLVGLCLKVLTATCTIQLLQNNGTAIPGLSFRNDIYEPMGDDEEDRADAAVINMPGALNSN